MKWHEQLAKWLSPETFNNIKLLKEEKEFLVLHRIDLNHKIGILIREISQLQSILQKHNEVHVVLGTDHDGEVYAWEAHFCKATAEHRRKALDNAAELAFKRRIHQIEQMHSLFRDKKLPDDPTIPWEDRMALFSLNGLGEYVGRVKFFVLTMPVGCPDKGKIIELLQAKETDAEAAGT